MANERARQKMIKARSGLVLEHPFFANLALRLEMREDPGCRTAWSDGRVMAYNPLYIESMPLEKVKGLQCHEVLHLVCCHHTRRGGRDKKLWNKACDYAINPILLEAGIELPTGYLEDPAHYGKTADAIYKVLVDMSDERKGGAQSGKGQEVDEDEDAEKNPGAENEDEESQAEQSEEMKDQDGGQEDENNDPGMSGEVRDTPLLVEGSDGEDELRREEEDWKTSLSQAVNKAREAGDLPGGLERLVGEILSPSLNWRELLSRFLAEAAKNDFTWVRPNRRRLQDGLYLPGLHSEELARVAIAVDVSGSIEQAELDAFASELSILLEEYDSALTVFTCDAAVTSMQQLGRWDLPLDFRAAGGGGTSFRPPFERLEQECVSPACLIYFTDMQSLSFPEEPAYPVMWVTPNLEYAPPSFGEVVIMEPSQ